MQEEWLHTLGNLTLTGYNSEYSDKPFAAKRDMDGGFMRFPDISDPRGICRDISGLGRWGNGDVDIRLSKHEEIPYVIGLVRQSLERQLGNEDAA
ncbi:MAG: DUF1524 domain-containing protein [Aliishimia sp.]